MNGIIKKIKNIFPVTTTKAVYIDGTNKTLQQAIDNGEIGGNTTATTSGRGYVEIKLRGAMVTVELVEESTSTPSRVKYSFPTGDSNRLRRMYAWTPSGGTKSIDLPDGTLALNEALIYNFDTNTTRTAINSWGNVSHANNEIVLLYNDCSTDNGHLCIGGALSPYIVTYEQPGGIPIREVPAELISTRGNGNSQGIFIIGERMYLWGHSSDDLETTEGGCIVRNLNDSNITDFKHFLGHMNAPSYSTTRDMMIVGNGSKLYDQTSLPMKGYICKNVKAVLEGMTSSSILRFSDMSAIELDFSQFTGEFKAQLCWGEDSTDYVFLMTNEHRTIRKLRLGKGTNDLGNGTIIGNCGENDYNGTYEVIQIWRTEHSDVVGGFKFYNGCLYSGVKGDIGIRKMELCSNGHIQNSYIMPANKSGTMQGLDIVGDTMYAYTDSAGYKINTKYI